MKKSLLVVAAVLLTLPFFAAAQESLPKINITLMSCTELQCTNQKDVFFVNESAYIDYNSTVKEISYSAILTFPDGTKYQTAFPNRIISNVTGNYTIELIAWKEGYLDTSISKVIRFVEKQPASNTENPPQVDLVRMLLVIIAAGFIIAVVWKITRRDRKPEKSEAPRKVAKKH
jgi:hypothetical protein